MGETEKGNNSTTYRNSNHPLTDWQGKGKEGFRGGREREEGVGLFIWTKSLRTKCKWAISHFYHIYPLIHNDGFNDMTSHYYFSIFYYFCFSIRQKFVFYHQWKKLWFIGQFTDESLYHKTAPCTMLMILLWLYLGPCMENSAFLACFQLHSSHFFSPLHTSNTSCRNSHNTAERESNSEQLWNVLF